MDSMTMPDWAVGVTRVVVFSGAGISTDSGVPDYRGPNGVWTRDPSATAGFSIDSFLADQATRAGLWRTYRDHAAWAARPNVAHEALADLERSGVAMRVLTQNVDGLHQRAGVSPRKVLELHGSMRETVCVSCRRRISTESLLDRVRAGDIDPSCVDCGGILKPAVVMFGEKLDGDTLSRARQIAGASQLMLAVGSSLLVEPAASLCAVAVECGARLVIVNRDPTPYDTLAVDVIREPIGTALPRITALLGRAAATA
ncbi:NAD-dependent deacetylase [Plantactinospora sp. GCM10030261]|uniref:SIR2 family NAD-dependent protein deacylase n=1 Tax=Plantactinospora sp. GCM10030261 TaxID=3273420 RepID=UPI003612D2CB